MLFQDMYNAYLNRVPVLGPLPPIAVFALAKCWERVIYLPKDVIVDEGTAVEALFFIVRGQVNLSSRLTYRSLGKLRLVDINPGGFFGESICHGQAGRGHPTAATSVTYTELLKIPAAGECVLEWLLGGAQRL
jgi:hypothetical protein